MAKEVLSSSLRDGIHFLGQSFNFCLSFEILIFLEIAHFKGKFFGSNWAIVPAGASFQYQSVMNHHHHQQLRQEYQDMPCRRAQNCFSLPTRTDTQSTLMTCTRGSLQPLPLPPRQARDFKMERHSGRGP